MSTKLLDRTEREAADRKIGHYEILIDNDLTRITQWTIRPGEQTGWHHHEHDYVTIQQSEGTLHMDFADGTSRDITYVPGTTVLIPAPVEHNATNAGDCDLRVLEIEYKN